MALSEDPHASERIAEFAASDRPWLVAVRMVSEGVDIPRLRLGVYATTTTTEPLVSKATVDRVEQAQSDLDGAFKGVTDSTPLSDASEQVNAAAFALEIASLRLFEEAGCFADDEQRALFERAIQRAADIWDGGIVTTIEPLGTFFRAEEYHQDFFAKNPGQGYCLAVALPKVNKVRKAYSQYILAS